MKSRASEELLWELTRVDPDSDEVALPDDVLRAYRSRKLSADARQRVEERLARGAASRQRLAQLAGVPTEVVSADSPRHGGIAARRWWGLAAAGLLIATLVPLAYWSVRDRSPAAVPGDAEFEVAIEGLARTRSESRSAEALPDTVVEITVSSRSEARAGLEFGLYRLQPPRLRRLGPADGMILETGRGAARFLIPAGELVGPAHGTHPFIVLIAAEDRLPQELLLGPGQDAARALATASGGKAYRHTLSIVDRDAELQR